MALSPTIQPVIDDLNATIRALMIERDRINNLFDQTLPGDPSPVSVWSFLPVDLQTQLQGTITTNLTSARDRLDVVISEFNSTQGVPGAVRSH